MTRYVLTPGLDRPDMIHAEPWDTERCPVDEVIHFDLSAEVAEEMLGSQKTIACRRCGVKDRSKPGDIPVLFAPEVE